MHIFRQNAQHKHEEEKMKEIWMVMGFGAGLVAGALLYKHCEDAKKLVNKGEKAVKQEVENLKETVKTEAKKAKKQMTKPQKQTNSQTK